MNGDSYEPGRLTSWTCDEGFAAAWAEEQDFSGEKIYVVLNYRGTKQLDKGMNVTEMSQHPDEDESIFSSSIKMKIAHEEITGYEKGYTGPGDTVYVNLYDPD